jgi:hypothetical protein
MIVSRTNHFLKLRLAFFETNSKSERNFSFAKSWNLHFCSFESKAVGEFHPARISSTYTQYKDLQVLCLLDP